MQRWRVFPKHREIWSKWRCCCNSVHSCAIVIYEDGPLDQLIGPIEIIFLPLPPPREGKSAACTRVRFETVEEEQRSAGAIENGR